MGLEELIHDIIHLLLKSMLAHRSDLGPLVSHRPLRSLHRDLSPREGLRSFRKRTTDIPDVGGAVDHVPGGWGSSRRRVTPREPNLAWKRRSPSEGLRAYEKGPESVARPWHPPGRQRRPARGPLAFLRHARATTHRSSPVRHRRRDHQRRSTTVLDWDRLRRGPRP